MGGGTTETHRDDYPMFTGTHKGANGSEYLIDKTAHFRTFGANPDAANYVHNLTQDTHGIVNYSDDEKLRAGSANINVFPVTLPLTFPVEWNYGDEYEVYITSSKNSFISREWVDLSRGWRTDPDKLQDGWKPEDIDLDDKGRKKVFGPGQPSRRRK